MVKIIGSPEGHSISWPTEIKKLFRPVKFCGGGKLVQYSLSALTDFMDDIVGIAGSWVLIATADDLKNFSNRQKPFIYVHHAIKRRSKDYESIACAQIGDTIKFKCGCEHQCVDMSAYPAEQHFAIVITGHMVDER